MLAGVSDAGCGCAQSNSPINIPSNVCVVLVCVCVREYLRLIRTLQVSKMRFSCMYLISHSWLRQKRREEDKKRRENEVEAGDRVR